LSPTFLLSDSGSKDGIEDNSNKKENEHSCSVEDENTSATTNRIVAWKNDKEGCGENTSRSGPIASRGAKDPFPPL